MKQIMKRALLTLTALTCILTVTACSGQQNNASSQSEVPSDNTVMTEGEVIGIVTEVSGQTVTVDIVEMNSTADRTAGNPYTSTGETREIEVMEDIELVSMTRGADGVAETPSSVGDISANDLLYLFYGKDGSLEKIRLMQR
jgi:hypothetical protein